MKTILFLVLLLTGCATNTEDTPPMTDAQRMMLFQLGTSLRATPQPTPIPVPRQTTCYRVGPQLQCMTY